MKLLPLARSLSLAAALAATASPALALRHAKHHHSESALRPGSDAVSWLRASEGRRLVTGETNYQLEMMSRDEQSFLGGAAGLIQHDIENRWQSAAGNDGPHVITVGNATLRNLGTVRDGRGYSAYDWLSFDHAGEGGALNDLRQLLVSLALLGREMGMDDSDISGVLLESMRTYRDAVDRFAGSPHASEYAMTSERANTWTRRMLNTASHRRREDLLNRWTVVGHEGRRFKLEGEFTSIEPAQAQAYWQALQGLKTDPRPPSYWLVKDAVVRSEDGKHRGPHHHVYLLIEGPTASVEDDFILEAYLPAQPARHVQWAAWKLRRTPEPFFGVIEVGGQDFLLREVQPELMPFGEERVEGMDDYYDVGRAAATLLARAHGATATSAEEVHHFAHEWIENPQSIEASLGHFAMRYAEQVRVDHASLAAHWSPSHTLVRHTHAGHKAHVAVTGTAVTPPAQATPKAGTLGKAAVTVPPPPPKIETPAPAGPPPTTPPPPPAQTPLQPPDEGR